jgi:hypothetical protein
MRFLHKRIKSIGSPDTHRFAAYLLRLRRKDTKYNWTPKHRAMKRAARREALQQAQQQLEEYEYGD